MPGGRRKHKGSKSAGSENESAFSGASNTLNTGTQGTYYENYQTDSVYEEASAGIPPLPAQESAAKIASDALYDIYDSLANMGRNKKPSHKDGQLSISGHSISKLSELVDQTRLRAAIDRAAGLTANADINEFTCDLVTPVIEAGKYTKRVPDINSLARSALSLVIAGSGHGLSRDTMVWYRRFSDKTFKRHTARMDGDEKLNTIMDSQFTTQFPEADYDCYGRRRRG